MANTNAKRIYLGLLAAAGCLLGMAVFAARSVWSFREASNLVIHTLEVERQVDGLRSAIQALQIGYRGYLIKGDPNFLESGDGQSLAVPRELAELRQLTADNASQQDRIRKLAALIDAKLAEIRRNVAIRDKGSIQSAAAILNGPRPSLMSDIQAALESILAEEGRLLAERQNRARRDGIASLVALGGGLAFGGCLLFAVYRLIRLREVDDDLLRRKADEIQDLYDQAPCGYHSVDAEGTMLAINDTELRWLGYQREELIGRKKHSDLMTPESQTRYFDLFRKFKEEGAVQNLEFDLVRRDGSILPVLLNSTAIYDETGEYVSCRSTVYDHTEGRRAEDVLRTAREYADSIVDTVRKPLVILTEDLVVNRASRAYYTTFETSPEETVGRALSELDDGCWNLPELVASLARILPENRTLEEFEIAREFPRIGAKVMLLNARKLYRPGNHTVMLLLAMEDITERKESERQLRQLNGELSSRTKELEAANSELESFSYSVSHDLRAPLRHISGYAQMLDRHLGERADEKTRHFLSTITAAAQQMGALIDELLEFSRIGRSQMKVHDVALEPLVKDVLLRLKSDIEDREIEWKIADLPHVEGDSTLLRQVLINLLGNAIKYTRHTQSARIELGVTTNGSDQSVIFVRDNGAGFDPKYVDKLFGVFQRLHSAAEFEGNGVGLATVRRIVQRHGGKVWAEGKPGVGATFFFSLPRHSDGSVQPASNSKS